MNATVRAYVTELVGSFVLVLLTAGAVCATGLPLLADKPTLGRVVPALAAGVAWAVALAFTVRISGGFLNPAITVTLWVFQKVDNKKALGLIAVQFLGAAVAGLVLRGLFFSNEKVLMETRLGTPHLNRATMDGESVDRSSVLQGIGIETVLTFLLVFAIFAFIFDPRFRKKAGDQVHSLSYLWLGLLVMAEVLVAYDLTGAGLNPARWLGTLIWETTVSGLEARHPFADHGPYWIGPILGSLLAGMLYTYALLPDDAKGPHKGELP
jgi:glycerol uptake facilitator-like aquaporin